CVVGGGAHDVVGRGIQRGQVPLVGVGLAQPGQAVVGTDLDHGPQRERLVYADRVQQRRIGERDRGDRDRRDPQRAHGGYLSRSLSEGFTQHHREQAGIVLVLYELHSNWRVGWRTSPAGNAAARWWRRPMPCETCASSSRCGTTGWGSGAGPKTPAWAARASSPRAGPIAP